MKKAIIVVLLSISLFSCDDGEYSDISFDKTVVVSVKKSPYPEYKYEVRLSRMEKGHYDTYLQTNDEFVPGDTLTFSKKKS